MKIKTKLIVYSVLSVLAAATLATIGAVLLIMDQTNRQNQSRLTNAMQGFNRQVTDQLNELTQAFEEYSNSELKAATATGAIETIYVASPTTKSFRFNLHELAFGLKLDAFALYFMAGYEEAERLHFIFNKNQGLIIVDEEADSKYILETFNVSGYIDETNLSEPKINFSDTYSQTAPFALRLRGGEVILVSHLEYNNPFSTTKAGNNQLGKFIFEKKFTLDIDTISQELGVVFNLFDVDGKLAGGSIPMEDLDVSTAEFTTEIIQQSDTNGTLYNALLTPIEYQGHTLGYLSVKIPQSDLANKIMESLIVLAIIAIGSVLVVGLISYFIVLGITRPITKTAELLRDIAEGEGDLTQRLVIRSKDEMGEMAHWFNQFISKVQEIIKEISADSETLSASSIELSSASSEMRKTSEVIASAISTEASATHESFATITTMVSSLESMFQKIKDIQNRAHGAEEVAKHGNEVVDETIDTMSRIESSTKEIGGVINVITEISNQTNLLSLNAAIEAAKAGDSGKGFAVVADEVRNLAEKSSVSVVEIQKLVQASAENVNAGVKIIQETQTLLEQIITQVQDISKYLSELTSGITEQENGIQAVSEGVEVISNLSDENSTMVKNLSDSITEAALTADDLSGLADSLTHKVNRFRY